MIRIFELGVANVSDAELRKSTLSPHLKYSKNRSFPARFAHFKKHALSGTLLFEKSKGHPSKLLPARRKTSDRDGV